MLFIVWVKTVEYSGYALCPSGNFLAISIKKTWLIITSTNFHKSCANLTLPIYCANLEVIFAIFEEGLLKSDFFL